MIIFVGSFDDFDDMDFSNMLKFSVFNNVIKVSLNDLDGLNFSNIFKYNNFW